MSGELRCICCRVDDVVEQRTDVPIRPSWIASHALTDARQRGLDETIAMMCPMHRRMFEETWTRTKGIREHAASLERAESGNRS